MLVRVTEQGMEVNEEALQIVRDIKGPIAVVSVCGMNNTGKSYLMNRMLLNKKQGFPVGRREQGEEMEGLMIWGKPLLGQTANLDTISILVIDSNTTKCAKLQTLLSSVLLYNLLPPVSS